ncbi:hypothetical protein ACE1OC_17560 [Streptomyces sp. DSM 116496]|uniref:hypothetical protein n=1 Tax=Streptomyces stoeckheimensis TaxID=3344656 RepID=UPI0038B394A5
MTRNQWIAMLSVMGTVVAALITAAAMFLTNSDKGDVRNDCSNSSQCAGHDINEKG